MFSPVTKKVALTSFSFNILNISGVTLHSLFQLPLSDFIVKEQIELKKNTIKILQKTDMIIIDEISMVRPDILDAIDYLLKKARGDFSAFGGVQMIFVGDLCQLPPVIKNTTYHIFQQKYGYSNVYQVTNYEHPFDGYQGQNVIIFEEFRSSLKIDDMLKFLTKNTKGCPYFRFYDEYKSVHKQI